MNNYFIRYQNNIFSDGPTMRRYWLPLDFLNAIALLRRDNLPARLITSKQARSLAKKERARFFISTTPLDLWQCPPLHIPAQFLRFCQNITSHSDLYITGYHGTLLPEFMLQLTKAQAVIRGEPEEVIHQIANSVPLEQIHGISFKKGERIIFQNGQVPCDLRQFPVPAYEQDNFDNYQYEPMGWKRFALFETSRGCKYNCDFCSKDVMYGKGFRQKTINQVKQELLTAIRGHGVKTGYFFDLNFLDDREMGKQICDYLIKESFDFQWCCQTRIDAVEEATLKLMAKAGCRLIHYGVESYRHLQGDKYKKEIGGSLNKIIQLTKSSGIKTLCFYIVGFNNYISQEDRDTLHLMHSVRSSYVALHQYYNFADRDFVKARILGKRAGLNSKIQIIIFFHLLRYYLNLLRIRDFLIFEKKATLLRRLCFFLKTIAVRRLGV